MTATTEPSALEQLRAALVCTDCTGDGCDGCDHTGQQLCEHPTGPAWNAYCEQPRPCPTHDRALIEDATL